MVSTTISRLRIPDRKSTILTGVEDNSVNPRAGTTDQA
jgi:hypothetical protein